MGEIKKIKCLATKTAFSSENNKPVTVLALVESSRNKVKIAKDYKLTNCSVAGSFRKNVKMAKSSSSLVRPQRKREGQKISTLVSAWSCFKLVTSLMFFAIFKVFSNLNTWGRTWQCATMTDFYRKVNKFFQKFAKCDPCLCPYAACVPVSWPSVQLLIRHWLGKVS